MKKLFSYVDGCYINDEYDRFTEIKNPASGAKEGVLFHASKKIIEDSIKSANKGFEIWSKICASERSNILKNIYKKIISMNDELAYIEVSDTGKPISEAISVDIISGAECIDYFAGITNKIVGMSQNLGSSMYYTINEPLGICLGIGAWNYPFQIACWKAAPALAAGNSMIFKPSELTSQTALKLAEIMVDAGLPKGVFNVVLGDATTGQRLISKSEIAKVSITGSVGTGKKVMSQSSDTVKYITMELGGKSPAIILDDADMDQTVDSIISGNFYTQGEICSNCTRVFVHRNIHKKFISLLLDKVKKIKIGDPLCSDTTMGALISEEHLKKVMNYVDIGKKEGAKLIYGGNKININGLGGYFMQPTIFDNCNDTMRIVNEEVFGPLMSILTFNNEEEVIERANNTNYGLAAGIFTNNINKAHILASKIKAGVCWINSYNITPVEMPFGGFKFSGIGRENGIESVRQYTQTKSVYIDFKK